MINYHTALYIIRVAAMYLEYCSGDYYTVMLIGMLDAHMH